MKPALHPWCRLIPAGSMHRLSMVLLLGMLCLAPGWSLSSPKDPEALLHPVAKFEGGTRYQAGRISILRMQGNYRQMGRQYGKLFANEMRGMYAEIVRQYDQQKIVSQSGSLEAFSKKLFGLYPKRFQDLAEGIHETSGIEAEKIAVLNEFFDYLLASTPGDSPDKGNHCSGIAVWGDYTGGRPLLLGRNFDFPNFFRNFNPYLVVLIFNPDDGSHPAATIAHAGQIGGIQAFNAKGLVLENNNGSNSGDKQRYFGERTPFLIKDLEMVLDHGSMEGLDGAMKGNRYHFPLVFNVASPSVAYCYETTTSDVKRRGGEREGLLIGVNHFIHQEWQLPVAGKDNYIEDSSERHRNLAALAEKHKGNIDETRMMAILDVPQQDGGSKPMDKSIYQFAFVPGTLKLWFKAEGYADWTGIALGNMFQKPGIAETELDVIQLDSGAISGKVDGGVRTFLGIPYAAPPVGALRWRPPQDVASWREIRNCTTFSRACPQPKQKDDSQFSEDCLYLNVWTTAKNNKEKQPVMVWIHGGAFNFGSASQPDYNGANLSRKGVVVVTINYRLGPLGFLVHPLLSKESIQGVSGNYGLLDQIAALKWVKRNIAAFGGNPDGVTIFGQSAGSRSVSLQMISPLSAGLFHRAIAQSGGPILGSEYLSPLFNGNMENVSRMGQRLAARLGCDKAEDVLAAMRAKSAQEIVAAADCTTSVFDDSGLFFAPVFDGWVLPRSPVTAFSGGKQHDVPIITGSTLNEGNLYIVDEKDLSVEKFNSFMKSRFGGNSDKAAGFFPVRDDKDVANAMDKVLTVAANAHPARFVAQSMTRIKAKAYLFQFTRRPDTAMARKMGVHHGVELAYVFGNMSKPDGYSDVDLELSRKIMDYWVNFARTGNPNGPGLMLWPAYEKETDVNIEFSDAIHMNRNLFKNESDFIELLPTCYSK